MIDIIKTNNRSVITNIPACPHNIFIPRRFPIKIFNKQVFRIIYKTLVDPHIGDILVSYTVSKPFMSRFMNNDKIKFISPTRPALISAKVSILISVAISNRTLMLHTKIRCLNQLITIFVKRIWSKPVFKCF